MLSAELVKKIEEFVYKEPRSIQEIATHIGKNWRTADRYIAEITNEYGTLATRVFREGTRGALKIVYWASIEKASSSVFQEQLEAAIINGKKKEDFSPFDIFQHIGNTNKKAQIEYGFSEEQTTLRDLQTFLRSAQKHLIIFSGNASFINFKDKSLDTFDSIEELVKKGVTIKVICRIDVAGRENIERLLSLNFKYGKERIEIRHREQPLRAMIIDKTVLRMKEIKEPTGRSHELKKKTFIFYTIKDKEWIEWLTKIFWKMFSASIAAPKRLEEMNKLTGP